MIDYTTALHSIADDLLKAVGHTNDALPDAEVITAALCAAYKFGGNIKRSRSFLRESGLMPRMLSCSPELPPAPRSRLLPRDFALFHR